MTLRGCRTGIDTRYRLLRRGRKRLRLGWHPSGLSVLPGEFGCEIIASEILCPGDSSCASLGFTPKDTGGEVIVQARDGEMFTLDTSTLLDFATSIPKDREPPSVLK